MRYLLILLLIPSVAAELYIDKGDEFYTLHTDDPISRFLLICYGEGDCEELQLHPYEQYTIPRDRQFTILEDDVLRYYANESPKSVPPQENITLISSVDYLSSTIKAYVIGIALVVVALLLLIVKKR